GNARHGDGFGGADKFVCERGRRIGRRQSVPWHSIIGERDGGGGGSVVGFVGAGGADEQGARRDIRRRRRGAIEGVVNGVRAGHSDAGDGDRFGGADVFIGESGGRVARGERIAWHAVIREGESGRDGAVVDFVNPARAHGQCAWGNVGSGAGGGIEGVIVRINAGQSNAGDRHSFADAHILVGEGGGAGSCAEHIAGHPVIGKGHGGGGITVVNLVDSGRAHGQGALSHVSGGGSGGVEGGILVGVGAADADAGDFNALVEADVFRVEGRRCVGDGKHVA